MQTIKMTAARNGLLQVPAGVERRLLYLGSGRDVGTSIGLFWHKCDSFYLVDPGFTTIISYDDIISNLAAGTATYMEGMQLSVSSIEEGFWESALPGRRYSVRWEGQGNAIKRLCFVRAGSDDWLKATNTRYNVAINKDYAGIPGEPPFPTFEVWDRLNEGGIFAQTMPAADETDYVAYRHQGFLPMFKVSTDGGAKVGFSGGLHLFQKIDNARRADYEAREVQLTRVGEQLMGKLLEISMHDPEDEPPLGPEFDGLYALMARPGIEHWARLRRQPEFLIWLRSLLHGADRMINPRMMLELISTLSMDTWGSKNFPNTSP